MPRFVEGPAIETAFSSGDETARVHERAINFCHDRRETHQRPCDLVRATTPVANARGETRVHMRSRERPNAGKTIGRAINASRLGHIERIHMHCDRDWMMAETNNDGSSFDAYSGTPHTYVHTARQTEMYATFREVYDTRHACVLHTHVHISRGRRCSADENSTGIARRDAFAEIYAVVAGILR